MSCVFGVEEFGRTFATRQRGAELRDRALSCCGEEPLILDFAHVTHVSYSFADEFVGKLSRDRPDVELRNMAGSVDGIVRRAQARRTTAIGF